MLALDGEDVFGQSIDDLHAPAVTFVVDCGPKWIEYCFCGKKRVDLMKHDVKIRNSAINDKNDLREQQNLPLKFMWDT